MNIAVETRSDHVWLQCTGQFDLESAKRAFALAYDKARESNVYKAVIDCRRMGGQPTATDRFELASSIAKSFLGQEPFRFTLLALIGEYPFIDPDRLGETVARNRGVPGIVTTSIKEAEEYLGIQLDREGGETGEAKAIRNLEAPVP